MGEYPAIFVQVRSKHTPSRFGVMHKGRGRGEGVYTEFHGTSLCDSVLVFNWQLLVVGWPTLLKYFGEPLMHEDSQILNE